MPFPPPTIRILEIFKYISFPRAIHCLFLSLLFPPTLNISALFLTILSCDPDTLSHLVLLLISLLIA